MDDRPADTTPEAWELFIQAHRRLTPAERLQRAFQLSNDLRARIHSAFRRLHPNASEYEIRVRAGAQYIDRETMIRIFGWDPESDDPVPQRL